MFNSFTDLPRLHDYADAVRHYNNIVPVRGSDNLRPLCNTTMGRRKRHLLIHESTVLGCKAMSCQLYNTDVISFLEDGRVHIDNSYASMSTNDFIKQLLGGVSGVSIATGQVWLASNNKYWVVGAEMVLVPEGLGWVPETPHGVFRSVVNRRAMNEVFKQYKPFVEHCKNVAKLMDAETVSQAYQGIGMITLKPPVDLATMTNPDRSGWSDLTLTVLKQGIVGLGYRAGRWERILKGEVAVKWLRRYLQEAHAREVFQLEEVPLGVFVRDANYKITARLMRNNK